MIRATSPRRTRDSSVPLINVVFLMLIFFLIAGTIAPPLDGDLQLVETSNLEGTEPPDALVMRADGSLRFRGAAITPEAFMEGRTPAPVRIVPDRNAAAARLVEVTRRLRALGATSVLLVTERSLG